MINRPPTLYDNNFIHRVPIDQCRDQPIPKKIDAVSNKKIALVTGGWRHTLAADKEGELYAWGWNQFGQLGLGDDQDRCLPERVQTLANDKVVLLSSGWKHTLVVTEKGDLYSWGRGAGGQLGRGDDTSDSNVPVLIPELSTKGVEIEKLMKQAHPVVMYSLPVGDRYAVVPDQEEGDDGEEAVPEVEENEVKRQKTVE